MRTQVQKWGNSLALRIPKPLAADSGLSCGTEVEFRVENGRILIVPIASWKTRLAEMIDRITDENRHDEISFGPPVGNEFW